MLGARTTGSALNPRLGDHVCLPFDTDGERIAAVRAITLNGLREGRLVLLVTESDTPQQVRGHLAGPGDGTGEWFDAEAAEAGGRLTILPADESHFSRGRFDPDLALTCLAAFGRHAERLGASGVSVLVDASWRLRADPGLSLEVEARGNALFAGSWMALVCQYDRRRFSGEAFDQAAAVHPITPGEAELRFARTPGGLTLAGEVDGTNIAALASVLDTLVPVARALTIDATALGYLDAEGARLLARTAELRVNETVIVCSPAVARLLSLIRADDVDRLSVRPAGP
ncbi:MEDS domain-containing protein [Nonomuraea soli]|uniref:Anti-anti-sigma regulatory factor n=1 Tax=Nonomuraea soli TaxID=1032476 RepID=A0A7W0CEN8_9ACTN|nr:MEDS domain-containing protein [Nonomuraea soli]MBA2889767.1 anti-anti-sigma regulatory factor [Nonomuraea soli]